MYDDELLEEYKSSENMNCQNNAKLNIVPESLPDGMLSKSMLRRTPRFPFVVTLKNSPR